MPGWSGRSKLKLPRSSIGCLGILVSLFGAFVVWGFIVGEPAPGAPLAAVAAGWALALFMMFCGAWILVKYLGERFGQRGNDLGAKRDTDHPI